MTTLTPNMLALLLLLLLNPITFGYDSSMQTPINITSSEENDANVSNFYMRQACFNSVDQQTCILSLQSELAKIGDGSPISVLHAAVKAIINEVQRSIDLITSFTTLSNNRREQNAITDCRELLDYSMDELGWSLKEIGKLRLGSKSHSRRKGNLDAWLSAALGNQDTCLEGFEGTNGNIKNFIEGSLKQVTQLVSNVLVVFKSIHSLPLKPPRNRENKTEHDDDQFPTWVSPQERAMMRAKPGEFHVDAVVALDGTGRHRSIAEAILEAPNYGTRRYVIYVKRGVYKENIDMKKKKTNIMLVGDGMGATIITGNRNFLQGWTTFRTATFAVSGMGFIAKDITFRNTAGPMNRQAVALRADSDRSAFYRCSFEGYQDTLYAHSLRQFYRECNIYGTIDFIFGNGAAVLQNCKIITRKPLPYQKTTITAQGRKDPNQSTGFSIQNSFVYAMYPTYLGRPWKMYSRVVFMQTYFNGQVAPEGWLEWYGNFALDTLYYGEYMNYGPGAAVNRRVRWPGYHVMRDASTASFFTVARFIDGQSWLPSTGIAFAVGLIK